VADYSTTLRRSLVDRAAALGSYINSLQARTSRTDDGFSLALEMCYRFTEFFGGLVREHWQLSPNPTTRLLMLRSLLREFREKEDWIDKRFTRTSSGDVPRALRTIVLREFRTLGP